jgi:hypothetical protein
MTDTPKYIKDIQKKLWLAKTPQERLLQFITDNDAAYKAFREFKIENGLPLGDLDPVGQYLAKKNKDQAQENAG